MTKCPFFRSRLIRLVFFFFNYYYVLNEIQGGQKAKEEARDLTVAYVCLACAKSKQTRLTVNVTSSESSSRHFTFEAFTVARTATLRPECGAILQQKQVLVAPPLLALGSAALYCRCAETIAVRTPPAASLSRGLHGDLVKGAGPKPSSNQRARLQNNGTQADVETKELTKKNEWHAEIWSKYLLKMPQFTCIMMQVPLWIILIGM